MLLISFKSYSSGILATAVSLQTSSTVVILLWNIKTEHCYVRVITQPICHSSTCYHQRENADGQDSVVCIKPVSGQPFEFLVMLFCWLLHVFCWVQLSLLSGRQFLINPFTFYTASAFHPLLTFFLKLVISVYLVSIKRTFQIWVTPLTHWIFFSVALRLTLYGVTGNKMI